MGGGCRDEKDLSIFVEQICTFVKSVKERTIEI